MAKKSENLEAKKLYKSPVVIVVVIILLLLLVAYLSRAWIRKTVIASSVDIFVGRQVDNAFKQETEKLQEPLALLGHSSGEPHGDNGCISTFYDGIKTKVNCLHAVNAWHEIDQSNKAGLVANAVKLEKLLQENGWQGDYEVNGDNNLTKLVTGITDGIDYYPDASYIKEIDGVSCIIMNTVAFSSPNPPAMNTHLSCSREFDILGNPLEY